MNQPYIGDAFVARDVQTNLWGEEMKIDHAEVIIFGTNEHGTFLLSAIYSDLVPLQSMPEHFCMSLHLKKGTTK